MFVQWVWRRQMAKSLAAFEAMDANRVAQFWPEDIVVEFPWGTPMAGEWRGKQEATAVLRALFAQNVSMTTTLRCVALDHPWSPTGTFNVFVEWSAVEVGVDGHVYEAQLVTVAAFRHWKQLRGRDYFHDVPGLAAHYAHVDMPPRQSPAPGVATDA
jgi:ketosteroid isomerase-like protein